MYLQRLNNQIENINTFTEEVLDFFYQVLHSIWTYHMHHAKYIWNGILPTQKLS